MEDKLINCMLLNCMENIKKCLNLLVRTNVRQRYKLYPSRSYVSIVAHTVVVLLYINIKHTYVYKNIF